MDRNHILKEIRRMVIALSLVSVTCLSTLVTRPSNADWFGPDDYDECILESMKGVTSDVAAKAIIRACRKKFPSDAPTKPVERLPAEVVQRLTGQLGIQSGYLSGKMYNGNEDWTITEVTVVIADKGWSKDFNDFLEGKIKDYAGGHEIEVYAISINLRPLSTAQIFTSVNWKEGRPFEWHIREATGFQ
jgi:hypothetical protein